MKLGTTSPPSLGHWLRLDFSADSLAEPDFPLTLSLHDLGITGLDDPVGLFSGSTQVVNANAAADSSLFPGFFGSYRAPYYDNFVVEPVPGRRVRWSGLAQASAFSSDGLGD